MKGVAVPQKRYLRRVSQVSPGVRTPLACIRHSGAPRRSACGSGCLSPTWAASSPGSPRGIAFSIVEPSSAGRVANPWAKLSAMRTGC